MGEGFEALADGTLLVTVLLVASSLATTFGGLPPAPTDLGSQYAVDTRLAVFRTTLNGLGFVEEGAFVPLPNGTTVETFLRLQVRLLEREGDLDFARANSRVASLVQDLIRPGWDIAILGGLPGSAPRVRIPEGGHLPDTHFASGWTYPALPGGRSETRLSVAVWPTPPR